MKTNKIVQVSDPKDILKCDDCGGNYSFLYTIQDVLGNTKFTYDNGICPSCVIASLEDKEFIYLEDFEQYKRESIKWSIEDFEAQAKNHCDDEKWELIYDRNKFQDALERMINKHDAEWGVNWTSIDCYLEECKREEWKVFLYRKDRELVDQTSIDELDEKLAWDLFEEFGHKKQDGDFIEFE